MKIILTGTPVQNNLLELNSLLDLIKNGILGTESKFIKEYATIIEEGLKKDATED